MSPRFPIRLIFDDGSCEIIESPEELMEKIDSIDSTDRASGVIVRDDLDRNVRLKMRNGEVLEFEAENHWK